METITLNFILKNVNALADWLWGAPLILLLIGGGLFLTVRLGFFQLRHFPFIMGQTFGKIFSKPEGQGTVSPFQAATSALASSIGASNIIGVPVAIAMGGPGAVFWMWVVSLVGMATKFSEVVLGIKYRKTNAAGEYVGGPVYYLRQGVGGRLGAILAFLCSFCFMLEIVPSISVQTMSITQTAETIGIPATYSAVSVFVLVVLVVYGGIQRISRVTEIMVPFMALTFVGCALIILGCHISQIPHAFYLIFSNAFSPTPAIGGFVGATAAMGLRWGAARGLYSNEAGMGSAPYAHSAAITDHPVRQGFWGVFEVFVTTIIICTMSALVVLTTDVWTTLPQAKAASMVAAAFQKTLGNHIGGMIVSLSMFLFVLSTVIVIVFYCEKQGEALFGFFFGKVMRAVASLAILYAIVGTLQDVFGLLDLLLAMVVIPNMIGVLALSGQVVALKREFFAQKKFYPKAKL